MPQYLPLLLVLFFGSGCAALIYEIVWLQLLQLVIGSSAVSMAVLLGIFMGGMCMGSLGFARFVSVKPHPLRVYAGLELATAAAGVAVFFGLPYIAHLYVAAAAGGFAGILVRAGFCALCLLVPTVLMGATLPAISRWITPSLYGWFYAANIAGGVFGCLLAGFWLLRVYDMGVASYVAVVINLAVAIAALGLAPAGSWLPTTTLLRVKNTSLLSSVHLAIGLSGLTAMGAEVIWTRLLSLTLGPTVYTFSIILAVFLIGLGSGSGVGSLLARRRANAAAQLGYCQAGLMIAIGWAGYMIARRLPYWDKNLSVHANPWLGFLFDLGCCLVALLPGSFLWGASFPLALAGAQRDDEDPARVVGLVYAANTLGAIAGTISFSLVMIPLVGSQNSERWLVSLSAIAAMILLTRRRTMSLAIIAAGVLFTWTMPAVPWKLIAFGRRMPMEEGPWKRLYAAEGMNSSIAYSEWVDKRRFFHVAGKVEASSGPADMKLQRMLGHIPALLHPNPRSILVVGCGAGVTAGTFVTHPEVKQITLCEIEPLIPPASARFFANENHHVVEDPRTRIVYDDARHYVLTTPARFDIITSDPIHPWVKGAATLYSKEYFEMCRAHLNPGGLVTQWVPLYESDPETVKSEVATFFDVFPAGVIWGNIDAFDQGYDLVMMGSNAPIRIDLDAAQRRFESAPAMAKSLRETGFRSASELLGTFAAQGGGLGAWLSHAQINRDRSLRLQYLAGMALNQGQAGSIYARILTPFPDNIFYGTAEQMRLLRKSFDDWRNSDF